LDTKSNAQRRAKAENHEAGVQQQCHLDLAKAFFEVPLIWSVALGLASHNRTRFCEGSLARNPAGLANRERAGRQRRNDVADAWSAETPRFDGNFSIRVRPFGLASSNRV